MPELSAIIGMVVGFLVVGVIGLYVGDTMLDVMNQSSPSLSVSKSPEPVSDSPIFNVVGVFAQIVLIVAVLGIIATLVQAVRHGGGGDGDNESESTAITPPEPQVQTHNIPQWRTSAPSVNTPPAPRQRPVGFEASPQHSYSNPFVDDRMSGGHLPESHYHNRFEAILEDEAELEK